MPSPSPVWILSCQDPPTWAGNHLTIARLPRKRTTVTVQGDVDSIQSLPNVNWKTDTNHYESLLDMAQIILKNSGCSFGDVSKWGPSVLRRKVSPIAPCPIVQLTSTRVPRSKQPDERGKIAPFQKSNKFWSEWMSIFQIDFPANPGDSKIP